LQPAASAPGAGAIPNVVRFSGSFHPSSGTPAQPVESVTLSVYRDQTGGSALWQETQNVAVDGEGKYSLLMGATRPEAIAGCAIDPDTLLSDQNASAEYRANLILVLARRAMEKLGTIQSFK